MHLSFAKSICIASNKVLLCMHHTSMLEDIFIKLTGRELRD